MKEVLAVVVALCASAVPTMVERIRPRGFQRAESNGNLGTALIAARPRQQGRLVAESRRVSAR